MAPFILRADDVEAITHSDPTPMPAPGYRLPETPSQKAARQRAADRERKRRERSEKRESGIPDAREIDRAIVDAIRDTPVPASYAGSGAQTHPREVVIVDVIRRATHALHGRGYMVEASIPAIVDRLSRDTGRAS